MRFEMKYVAKLQKAIGTHKNTMDVALENGFTGNMMSGNGWSAVNILIPGRCAMSAIKIYANQCDTNVSSVIEIMKRAAVLNMFPRIKLHV
mmetsp:Transcript_12495/g.22642  ORF Transcript_12495/g.22642 Transcript_12495/m.22642 type:complete len:91 (-) Transcript_12495:4060-4332(-)